VFVVAFILLFAVQRAIAWVAPDRTNTPAPPPAVSPDVAGRSAYSSGYRAVIVALALVLGAVAIARASKSEMPPPRESLATFPMTIAEWNGQPTERFDQQILTVLGVDDYLNRVYTAPTNISVGLYIGYYKSQREGDTMHSPLNCLPGAGWQPVKQERVTIPVGTSLDAATGQPLGRREILVNRFVIQKGLEKQVVIYWYQSHGRVVASE
jgi:EpsI family protein